MEAPKLENLCVIDGVDKPITLQYICELFTVRHLFHVDNMETHIVFATDEKGNYCFFQPSQLPEYAGGYHCLSGGKFMDIHDSKDGVEFYFHENWASLIKDRADDLELAIRETLQDNLHLADGENCTLIKLKRAIGYE